MKEHLPIRSADESCGASDLGRRVSGAEAASIAEELGVRFNALTVPVQHVTALRTVLTTERQQLGRIANAAGLQRREARLALDQLCTSGVVDHEYFSHNHYYRMRVPVSVAARVTTLELWSQMSESVRAMIVWDLVVSLSSDVLEAARRVHGSGDSRLVDAVNCGELDACEAAAQLSGHPGDD